MAKTKKEKKNNKISSTSKEEAVPSPGVTSEQIEDEMKSGLKDEDIYDEDGMQVLEEDEDELQPADAGFMEGAMGDGQLAKDAFTGEPLGDVSQVFETKIKGEKYRFTSKKNAQDFEKKLKKGKKE